MRHFRWVWLLVAGALVTGGIVAWTVASGGSETENRRQTTTQPKQKQTRPPNILLVITDDQRRDTLSAMPIVQRRLVQKGVLFANAFVVNPLCCPSRVSIFTGKYSHSTGVYTNDPPFGGFEKFDDKSTLATWLDDAGYETAYVGKYLNGYSGRYVPPGWDRWVVFDGSPGYYDYTLNVNKKLKRYGQRRPSYSTRLLGRSAVNFVRGAKRPFFLTFAPYAPHTPAIPAHRYRKAFRDFGLPPPPVYNERDVSDKPLWVRLQRRVNRKDRARLQEFRRRQLATLLSVDDAVGEILDAIAANNQLKNTVVVFMSDNGLQQGEHRLRAGKNAAYEESIWVPLVIRYPQMVKTPRTETRPVAAIDLAPTLAKLAGADAPSVEGASLVPLLAGRPVEWRRWFLIEHVRSTRLGIGAIPTFCAVRSDRFKYVAYETREEELYDLRADPYELVNQEANPAYEGVLLTMRRRLKQACDPPPPGFETNWIETG